MFSECSYAATLMIIQHTRVHVTSISHDRHSSIPIIARMNGCHDVWAQLHTYSQIFATIVSIHHVIYS